MGHMGDFVTFPGEWFRGGFLHDRLGKRLRGFRGALKGGKNVMIIYQRFFPHAVPFSGEMKKTYQISPPLNKANLIACLRPSYLFRPKELSAKVPITPICTH